MAPREKVQSSSSSSSDSLPESNVVEPKDRTVKDYGDLHDIRKALREVDITGNRDWVLKNYDAKSTIDDPNKIKSEAERLAVLKSYDIVDTAKEDGFEEITKECARLLSCPIAIVSLVDMGRQWFKSIQGLPAESSPRCVAFCAHVVKKKHDDVMVVTDALKDSRFKDNPFVTGGPKIRFYAGAPLKTPEGAAVGSLCVIDFEPHPEGLSETKKKQMMALAQQVVYQMITRVE